MGQTCPELVLFSYTLYCALKVVSKTSGIAVPACPEVTWWYKTLICLVRGFIFGIHANSKVPEFSSNIFQ